MKRILRNISVMLLCCTLAAPAAMADNRKGNNRHQGAERTQQSHSRPATGTSGRPGIGVPSNGGNHKPNAGQKPPTVKPGNNNHKPNNGNHHNNNGWNKPNNGNNGNHNGWNKPNHNQPAHRPPIMQPPHRPNRPVFARPHYRPTPPPAWRPRKGLPVIHGILGLAFGTAINLSLDYLFGNGFTVDGYGNDVVYLRNVAALNYMWTDAALYYGASGLDASSFYYSTPGYDMSRYNNCYRALTATYGVPVSVNNTAAGVTATWFGGNRGYITLQFGSGTGGRFLTTLSYGM